MKPIYILFLWAMILYGAVHKEIEKWVYGKWPGLSEALYAALKSCNLFALSTSLLLFGGMLYLLCRKCEDKNFSVLRLLWCLFAIEVLWLVGEDWQCPTSGFAYMPLFHWTIILMIAYIVANAVRYISNCHDVKDERCNRVSWTVDTTNPRMLDSVRAQYADHILRKLRNVDNSTDSYAIVIYGSWGTGKTTFLNHIKSRLEETNENVVEFNPWNSQTPQQVVADFFAALVGCLSQYDSTLARPIVRYSEMLETVDVPKPLGYMSSLLSSHDDSLSELKNRIVESLKRIQIPIYVLIDDLDRMNKEEVFAVIRLIRNTVNFPYLKFVVVCDYDYIEKLLDIKYLEKIFMAEFLLPAILAEFPCADACRADVFEMTTEKVVKEFFQSLLVDDKKLIEQTLVNLRQAKRFARALVTDWDFAKKNRVGQQTEIWFNDYFWIELLRHSHLSVYQDLSHNPLDYLEVKDNAGNRVNKYVFKNDDNKAEDVPNRLAIQILQKLFGHEYHNPTRFNTISLVENFDKYFAFGKAAGHLTMSDYVGLLHFDGSDDELSEKIAALSTSEVDSLYNNIMRTNLTKLNLKTKKAYIDLITACGYRLTHSALNDIVEHKAPDFLKDRDVKETKSYFVKKMKVTSTSYRKILVSNYICVGLLLHLSLNNTQKDALKLIVKDNFKHYISTNPCDAADILNKNAMLYQIVSASMLATPRFDEEDGYDYTVYDCLVFDEIIEWFRDHKSHRMDDVKFFEELEILEELPPAACEDMRESKRDEIIALFGSIENYEKFKTECFV